MSSIKTSAAFLLIVFVLCSLAGAQETSTVTEPTGIFKVYDGGGLRRGELTFASQTAGDQSLDSKLMARKMPYNVIVPAKYDAKENATVKYPVIYLLHGLTGKYDNWPTRTKLQEYAKSVDAIIVSVEGANGWYTDSFTDVNDKYESYIIQELVPEVEKKFRADSRREKRAIAGLSMGGYGALKFGIKYPQMFVLAGSFSGALGAATYPDLGRSDASLNSLKTVFGPADSDLRKANDIFSLIRQATPEQIKALPFLYVDCGTEDFLFSNNQEFMNLLVQKKVVHEFRQLPGAHTWPYWDKQIQEFLRLAARTF